MLYHLHSEKIPLENLLVITDDLNINFGAIRLRAKGSHGGHNGLRNIQEILGTSEYPRIRIGIGDNFSKGKQVDFVLGKWSSDEKIVVSQLIHDASEAIWTFGKSGIKEAIQKHNKKSPQ